MQLPKTGSTKSTPLSARGPGENRHGPPDPLFELCSRPSTSISRYSPSTSRMQCTSVNSECLPSTRPGTSRYSSRNSHHESAGYERDALRLDASEDMSTDIAEDMHPIVRAAREEYLKSGLVVADLWKRGLAEHFQEYDLNDYFDDTGQRRYSNLSMTVAAKRHPVVEKKIGSVAISAAASKGAASFSARAYRMATATVEKDRQMHRQDVASNFEALSLDRKEQLKDWKNRQLELVFQEVHKSDDHDGELSSSDEEGKHQPSPCRYFLPPGISEKAVLPIGINSRKLERDERKRCERHNMFLTDSTPQNVAAVRSQGWLFNFQEVQEISKKASGWMTAAGLAPTLGVDRSTFSQILVDLSLIDQESLPYVWAHDVFDAHAKHFRLCAGDPDYADQTLDGRVRTVALVSKWDFVAVIDALIRRRWFDGQRDALLSRLRAVVEILEKDWKQKEVKAKQQALEAQHRLELWREQQKHIGPSNSASHGSRSTPISAGIDSKEKIQESQVWKQDRNILSMLREPEVLQIVEQFRSLFMSLYYCYGGRMQKHMPQERFLAFCYDFNIIPKLSSRHEALRVYEDAVCVENVKSPSYAEERRKSAGDINHKQKEAPEMSIPGNRRTSSIRERKTSTSSVGSAGLSPSPSPSGRMAAQGSTSRSSSKGSVDFNVPVVNQGRSTPQRRLQSAAVKVMAARKKEDEEEEEEKQEEDEAKDAGITEFGPAAFVECICRLTFQYQLAYGNTVQLAMTTQCRLCWTMAYLRGILEQVWTSPRRVVSGFDDFQFSNFSLTSSSGKKNGTNRSEYFEQVLRSVRPEAFDEATLPETQAKLGKSPGDGPSRATSGTPTDITAAAAFASQWNMKFQKASTLAALEGKAERLQASEESKIDKPKPVLKAPGLDIPKIEIPPFVRDNFQVKSLLLYKLLESSVKVSPPKETKRLKGKTKRMLKKVLKRGSTMPS
eukprot:TRINITY_DN3312_c0_g1_i2.p1 TRINITY_DN3312_c0_g1~~TRINITY_DN3312_c0_g1_i2.p1  ORF type:complete len:954 (-),score=170.72 TRINITY_DN3312_c0_g1_i2:32-2893(-)